GKKDASIIIASQMLDFMKARKMYPPTTKIKKTYSNGNVDLDYSPTEYDSFTIHLTPKMVDGIVEDFLDDLSPFKDEEPEPEESWKVEPAKSSRATCKSCSRPIQQGAIRLGEPTFYEGHINYRWHHLKCAARMIKGLKFETLLGYQELTEEQKKELDRI
ncbi:MAG: PARP-type zinc finger-containing protein, partial [Candidatus Thorarchaeota archaeon]